MLTPSPACMLSKRTRYHGPNDTPNGNHRDGKSNDDGPRSRSATNRHHHQRPTRQTRGSHARDGPPSNDSRTRRRQSTNDIACFEDGKERQEGVLDGKGSVEFSGQGLQGAEGEEVRGAVPADVGGGVEVVGDGRGGCGDDADVEAEEEHTDYDGGDDTVHAEAGEVLALFGRRSGSLIVLRPRELLLVSRNVLGVIEFDFGHAAEKGVLLLPPL